MINQAEKVLDGGMREIRHSFARNAVALELENGGGVLKDSSLVANVRENNGYTEVLLAPGADAQQLLKRLVESGATVNRFELVEPSLHDIFIEKVRQS
jgi:ABC-2 type transport system ATP-binding protein